MVNLLLIVASIVVGVLCLVLLLIYLALCVLLVFGKTELVAFLTVFLMSCDSQCSVALSHAAEGWSAVCDCGIS